MVTEQVIERPRVRTWVSQLFFERKKRGNGGFTDCSLYAVGSWNLLPQEPVCTEFINMIIGSNLTILPQLKT